ncbi:hypothetical protein I316_07828 [Kwoniella heveanensis BCC8398]|uniref:Uncharacterized protein n=1 Tax=Kwoniella heveanensis BCC8398 TaxID=1296120 RepID=A0A1B9GHN6_9TREE|nr:hypothetical protein I316_07828 [Kwoniella heveanensis BCC8398]
MSLFQTGAGDSSYSQQPPVEPITASAYLSKLHKYLTANASRLSPSAPPAPPRSGRSTSASASGTAGTILQQSYTLLTLGLDPNSAPLSRSLKVPLTLGFGTPSSSPSRNPNSSSSRPSTPRIPIRPLLLRLPPDRLLYLLLRWQSLPQNLPHVGRTDVPIEDGVPVAARGARLDDGSASSKGIEGDVRSVRSWVGSMRSVSMGSLVGKEGGRGWFGGRKEEINEDQILLALYSMFTLLPALLIHPPFVSEPPILELIEAGGYTQLGGIDVRVPLDVLRNLSILELEGYDPRALLIPYNLNMRSLTVKDVQDGDDWIEELLILESTTITPISEANSTLDDPEPAKNAGNEAVSDQEEDDIKRKARFPNLRHLSLMRTNLLSLPTLPLQSLTHLDLSHNLLNSIPSSLAGLTSLTSLNLSNNVITSLRSAETSLSSIVSLNLSSNRIDCLVGLDRIPSLQRVDVRRNELLEVGEVGRLAILPRIKEVWCSGNGFDIAGEDEWRIELGATFREEGREVIVDDSDFSWSENRRIDALLASRGRMGGRVWNPASNHHPHPHSHDLGDATSLSRATGAPSSVRNNTVIPDEARPSTDNNAVVQNIHSRHSSTRSQLVAGPSTSISRAGPGAGGIASPASASSAAVAKKKGRRRVIHLDSSETVNTTSGDLNAALSLGSGSVSVRSLSGLNDGDGNVGRVGAGAGGGGSVRLPGKVVEEVEAESGLDRDGDELRDGAGTSSNAAGDRVSMGAAGTAPIRGNDNRDKKNGSHDLSSENINGKGDANGNRDGSGVSDNKATHENNIKARTTDDIAVNDDTRVKDNKDSGSITENAATQPTTPSVKVVSSKRRNNRKALKKDTFDPIL